MKVHEPRSLILPGSVLTIGALDGLHRGHQKLIRKAKRHAEKMDVPLVVYTFDPPPKVYFQHVIQIMTINEKLKVLEELGVDHTIVMDFNANYISQGADVFIEELSYLTPLLICEGHDFRFGRDREGDIDELKRYFNVEIIDPVLCDANQIISSTRIRMLLMRGNTSVAMELLGWENFRNVPLNIL